MKTRGQKIIIAATVVILICVIGAVLFIMFEDGADSTKTETQSEIIDTAVVTRGDLEKSITGSGTVAAGNTQNVVMPIGGRVDEILVKNGAPISKGDNLALLDTDLLQENLDAMQIELSDKVQMVSETAVDTQRINVRSPIDGVVSDKHLTYNEEVDDLMSEFGSLLAITGDDGEIIVIGEDVPSGIVRSVYVSSGESVDFGEVLFYIYFDTDALAVLYEQIDELKQDIEKISSLIENPFITTEFGGFANGINSEHFDGLDLAEDDKIFEINTFDGYIVQITIGQTDVGSVFADQPAMVSVESGIELPGFVSHINYVGTAGDFIVEVEIGDCLQIQNGEVLIGEEVSVSIFIESKKNVLKVPLEAVFSDSEGEYVMVYIGQGDASGYEDTQIPTEKRYIERGMISELYAEILSGVNEGEEVLVVRSSNEQSIEEQIGKGGMGNAAIRLVK